MTTIPYRPSSAFVLRAWFALGLCATVTAASGFSGWRGNATGRFPDYAGSLALEASATPRWETPTPQWSNAGPIRIGDALFILAEPDVLICLDAETGGIRWQQANGYADIVPEAEREAVREKMAQAAAIQGDLNRVTRQLRQLDRQARDNPLSAEDETQRETLRARQRELNQSLDPLRAYNLPQTHNANGFTSSVPVTDGRHVYVLFGSGVAAAYDVQGNRLWARLVAQPTDNWGHSASPVMADGTLVVHIRNLYGLDPATGETRWEVDSRARWGASVATDIDGHAVVISPNGEIVRAEDGVVLAKGLHALDYNAPVVQEDVVYFIEHGGKAYRLPSVADGSVAPELRWQTEPPRDRYYASPLYHDGRLYAITRAGVLSVIDAADGTVLASETLEGLRQTAYPSITLAGTALFVGSESGQYVFLEPGTQMTVLAQGSLGRFRSTPVFTDRHVFVRTLDAMLRIGPPE